MTCSEILLYSALSLGHASNPWVLKIITKKLMDEHFGTMEELVEIRDIPIEHVFPLRNLLNLERGIASFAIVVDRDGRHGTIMARRFLEK